MANTINLNNSAIVAALINYPFDVLKHIQIERSAVTDRFQVKMILEIEAQDELAVYHRLVTAFKLCVPQA